MKRTDEIAATNKITAINKGHICTLLILLLSLLIIFGGWVLAKRILKHKEAQLLAKSGQLHIADAGYSLQQEDKPEKDTSTGADGPDPFQAEELSEDVMAQLLDIWESEGYRLPHEPQKGQMHIEQAITAGSAWIAGLSEQGFLPPGLTENSFLHVVSMLYTLEHKTGIPDYLLGWWEILYIKDGIQITLNIHAASGHVWRAKVSMYESSMPVPLHEEGKLLDAAFPFIEAGSASKEMAVAKDTYSKICKFSPGGKVYADIGWEMVSSDEEESLMQMTISLHSINL